ncbi:hypothetical protein HYPSUDRAFT_46388 [Hypholoma sublateritium FD-334 SS-4]|uniref:Uncharacterized protein n=1 Tax=Hypholoma sublateritium (strain FD-334 SS-4) TaxID=945553 RepID=A0A0D2PAT6_HYPSF|nr:hypothetical protein HYPSUDRAFT_46388 [Hypholoma sublateritium FD-334 SS-4]
MRKRLAIWGSSLVCKCASAPTAVYTVHRSEPARLPVEEQHAVLVCRLNTDAGNAPADPISPPSAQPLFTRQSVCRRPIPRIPYGVGTRATWSCGLKSAHACCPRKQSSSCQSLDYRDVL